MRIPAWDREFQVWQYSVSHSVLLLRSADSDRYGSRVDVLFPAVELMKLRPTYDSLRIDIATAEDQARIFGEAPPSFSHGSLFLLNGGEGYVWAADCQWHEDDGDYRTPSRFGPLRGTA